MNNHYTKEFIHDFFSQLSERDIRYCILRGYDGLPERAGRDIDIFIEDQKEIRNVIEDIFKCLNWDWYKRNDQDGFFTYICDRVDGSTVSVLQLDFWVSLNWRGIPWCSSQEILSDRRSYKGYFIPACGSEAAVTGIKELIGGGYVKEKYYDTIQFMIQNDKDKFIRCLQPALGDFSKELAANFLSGDFHWINQQSARIKRILKKRNWGCYCWMSIQRGLSKLSEWVSPKGKLIAFVGPDGSGKTTIIELVSEYLRPYFNGIRTYHIRYEILPELKTGFGFSSMGGTLGKNEENKSAVKQEKVKKRKRSLISILASWVVVIYYTLEFVLGNTIANRCRRKKMLVMYDRYYYDHFLQPTTRDLIYPFRKILLRLVKKPDLVVHLNADPNVVYARKQELKPEEIETQNQYIERLLQDVDTAITINTSTKDISEIAKEVFCVCKNVLKSNIT